MKVYLAAPYGSRERIRLYADGLSKRFDGQVTCSSSWLEETHAINPGTEGAAPALLTDVVAGHAEQDLVDVFGSDLLVLFTSAAVGVEGGGGRHVETGYALGLGVPVIVVGNPENVFHRMQLPKVQVVSAWPAVLPLIERRLDGACVGCGCTDELACVGGCSWAHPNVCSRCAR